jgi:hypothetical protein
MWPEDYQTCKAGIGFIQLFIGCELLTGEGLKEVSRRSAP